MPRPLQKRVPPKPRAVAIRRAGSDGQVEVVSHDELARRKEEAEWQRYRRSHGLDVELEHALLALQIGNVVTVASYTHQVWWFVRDVNGIDRIITACTFIFEQPRERAFPFDPVKPLRLWHTHERNEAARYYALL